jgi:hypothetical protein
MTRCLRALAQELDTILKAKRYDLNQKVQRKDGSWWIKTENGMRPLKDGKGERGRLPHDASVTQARQLKASAWGTPEEVAEMAKTPRLVYGLEEAEKILKEVAKRGALRSKSGFEGVLSGKSIKEILSGQETKKSFDRKAHYLAAANIDKLFSNAIEPWTFDLDPRKNNAELKNRRYLYAPMEYNDKIIPVRFTTKEYKQKDDNKRIYSITAIDVKIMETKKEATLDYNAPLKKSQERPSNSSSLDNRVAPGQLKVGVITKSTALNPSRVDATHGVLNLETCVSPPTIPSYSKRIAYVFDSVNRRLISKRRLGALRTLAQELARFKQRELWND